MAFHDYTLTTLKALNINESWLRDWLKEKPDRLGLGNISIKKVEVRQYGKARGRLDI